LTTSYKLVGNPGCQPGFATSFQLTKRNKHSRPNQLCYKSTKMRGNRDKAKVRETRRFSGFKNWCYNGN